MIGSNDDDVELEYKGQVQLLQIETLIKGWGAGNSFNSGLRRVYFWLIGSIIITPIVYIHQKKS
jgi:hypothetical protein